jgi:hypothetical protein
MQKLPKILFVPVFTKSIQLDILALIKKPAIRSNMVNDKRTMVIGSLVAFY